MKYGTVEDVEKAAAQLALAAQVKAREEFRREALPAIFAARELCGRSDHIAFAARDLEGLTDDLQRLRKRVSRLHIAEQILLRLRAAQSAGEIERYLSMQLARRSDCEAADEIADYLRTQGLNLAAILPLLGDVIVAAQAAKIGLRGPRKKDPWAHQLIIWLEASAVRAGGSFRFDHHGLTGSLIDGLTVLMPLFPPEFFPDPASAYAGYQRDLREGRRIARSPTETTYQN